MQPSNQQLLLGHREKSHHVDPTWHDEPLPLWSYDPVAMNYARLRLSDTDSAFRSFEAFAVLNWKNAVQANMVLWSFWCLFPFICYPFTECNDIGFAKASPALLLLYLPCLAWALHKEMAIHQTLLPLQTKYLGGYKLMGWRVPFQLYLPMLLVLSTLAHMDLATNGLFMARLFKTSSCPKTQVVNIWKSVIADSWIPILPALKWIGVCIWLMMGSQPLFAFYTAYPLKPLEKHDIDLNKLWQGEGLYNPKKQVVDGIQTCSGQVMPSDALDSLAVSARMYLVTFRHLKFLHMVRGKRLKFGPHSRRTWVITMLKVASRCFWYTLLETATLANLQASCLGVTKAAQAKAAQAKSLDVLSTISIILSVVMSMLTFVFSAQQMWKMGFDIWPHIDERHASKERVEQPFKNKIRLILASMLFLAAATYSLWLNIYASIKLFMVFECDYGVWNWDLPLADGCISADALS